MTYKHVMANSQSTTLSFKEAANEPGNLKTQIAPDNCLLLESLSGCVAVKYEREKKGHLFRKKLVKF